MQDKEVSHLDPDQFPFPVPQSHLGLALEVKGEDIFSTSCLTLANQEDAVARCAARQHQLGSFEA